ncbi:homoserine dehydrogenase [Gloeomargarita lithophora Alchichica-D10]|uniref:Homoserine dehydrogenase n=1 Tax=Gloeomargarita lithophora Alchichica-D10 TaxID=1188229 RepID=A0A1J0ABS1_9CYAN|nr:homoserine dehydrogenase [Gloeomargarita lithophora]APB33345.1 homoserine dehydrogenase [Gloeomargarita lithophora Alchichica-D10]
MADHNNQTIRVGLLGLGTVGAGVAQILLDPKGRHPLLSELTLHRVGVRSLDKPRTLSLPPGVLTTDLAALVHDPAIDLVVEVLGGLEPARSLMLQAIGQGKHVVTANKAVMARHGAELFQAAQAQGVYVLMEGAVGGGIPIIHPLKQALGANRLTRILGIVNGTTNFILTQMTQGRGDFATALATAQSLGYAESDPSADVEGEDAADKIAILATLAFGVQVNRQQVYCEGIGGIQAVDLRYAERLGFQVKLLALAQRQGEALDIRVHPTLISQDHPLASVQGVQNAIVLGGEPLGEVMLQGPGAGAGPTASAVVGDVVNVAATLRADSGYHPLLGSGLTTPMPQLPTDAVQTRFYTRILTQDQPGVIGQLGTCFGDQGVSLASIVQIGSHEQLAEIVVVTHRVREGNFWLALAEIRQFPAVAAIPTVLRVWS